MFHHQQPNSRRHHEHGHDYRRWTSRSTYPYGALIDMLYSPYRDFSDELENFAALRTCALICHNWRIHCQRMLLYAVHLNDATSLCRFAAVLQAEAVLLRTSRSGRHWPAGVP